MAAAAESNKAWRRPALLPSTAVAVTVVIAAVVFAPSHRRGLEPRDETAALVQTWWRHAVSATAVVTTCVDTGARDVRFFSAPVYACRLVSPGSSYSRTICVSVREHVVWRRLSPRSPLVPARFGCE